MNRIARGPAIGAVCAVVASVALVLVARALGPASTAPSSVDAPVTARPRPSATVFEPVPEDPSASPEPTPTPTPSTVPATTGPAASSPPAPAAPRPLGLADARKKDIALQLVSSNENSSLDWRAQFAYIEDIGDGRGYTGGIVGFCSGTGDMLDLVQAYTRAEPNNILAKYVPALRKVNGTSSHSGLDPNFARDWRTAARDAVFQATQEAERDRVYFGPAVQQAQSDGLKTLGQFIYYDAMVMHGPGSDPVSFGGIRSTAMRAARTPAQGGSETAYLNAFLDARKAAMLTEQAHDDTSRVDDEQRVFVRNGNLQLDTPLSWRVYGDPYVISH